MAPAPAMQLTCPVCKMVCDLPANVESLPTNLHAMHIIQLNKIVEDKNKLIAEKIGKKWVHHQLLHLNILILNVSNLRLILFILPLKLVRDMWTTG